MDKSPDDELPSQETLEALVRALEEHRDSLVHASLLLKDLMAATDSAERQAVTAHLQRYLGAMAQGAHAQEGGARPPPESGAVP